MKLGLSVVLLWFLISSALARLPPPPPHGCKPTPYLYCSRHRPCPPGYQCINRRCVCITIHPPSCPPGYIHGGPCNYTPGKPKCGYNYQCINGQCCKQISYG